MFHVKHEDIEKYINELNKLELKAQNNGEIPVGAIVIYKEKIIGKGYNTRQFHYDVCGHAEINAIKQAEKKIEDWRLNNCTLICTLKPCNLCMLAIKETRIQKVYYFVNQKVKNNFTNITCEKIYFPGNKKIENFQNLLTSF